MRILLTGALGQIGSELTVKLRSIHNNVIITDIRDNVNRENTSLIPSEVLSLYIKL